MNNRGIAESRIYNISKKIVHENFPEELGFFDIVWETVRDHISSWKNISLEKWSGKESQEKLLKNLGFTDASQALDLITPVIIFCLKAPVEAIKDIGYVPRYEEIEKIAEKCALEFGAKRILITVIKRYLKDLCLVLPEILEETKEKKDLLQATQTEDTLEIGVFDGRPIVKINGNEVIEFRTKYKQFANLVALAGARIKGEGWIDRKKLDLGNKDQTLTDLRTWIVHNLLVRDMSKTDVIKSGEQRDGTIMLEIFKPENIKIDKSTAKFRPRAIRIAKELIDKANRREECIEGIQALLEKPEYKKLAESLDLIRRQMECVEMGIKYLNLELDEKNWRELIEKGNVILKKCKAFYDK